MSYTMLRDPNKQIVLGAISFDSSTEEHEQKRRYLSSISPAVSTTLRGTQLDGKVFHFPLANAETTIRTSRRDSFLASHNLTCPRNFVNTIADAPFHFMVIVAVLSYRTKFIGYSPLTPLGLPFTIYLIIPTSH